MSASLLKPFGDPTASDIIVESIGTGQSETKPPSDKLPSSFESPSAPVPDRTRDDKDGDENKKAKDTDDRKRVQVDLAPAAGVLAVHVKQATFFNLDPDKNYNNPDDLNVYIRINAGKQMKVTCVYENVYTPTKVIFDEIKHFLLTVPTTKTHPGNVLTMEVVVFDKGNPSEHRLLAVKQIHLYDVINKLYAVETYDFWLHRVQKQVAELDVELCFAYGTFGYGYSNQLENRQKTPMVQLRHSLFFRSEPPYHRQEVQDGDEAVLTSLPVGHPSFINFPDKVRMGSLGREWQEVDDKSWLGPATPTMLVARINKRMHKLQKTYSKLPSRRDRIKYLRQLIMNTDGGKASLSGEFFEVDKNTHLKRRLHRPQRALAVNADDDDASPAGDILDVEALANLMAMAPGIQRRGTQHVTKGARFAKPLSLAAKADAKDRNAVEYWRGELAKRGEAATQAEYEESRDEYVQSTFLPETIQESEGEEDEDEVESLPTLMTSQSDKKGVAQPRQRKITPMPVFRTPQSLTEKSTEGPTAVPTIVEPPEGVPVQPRRRKITPMPVFRTPPAIDEPSDEAKDQLMPIFGNAPDGKDQNEANQEPRKLKKGSRFLPKFTNSSTSVSSGRSQGKRSRGRTFGIIAGVINHNVIDAATKVRSFLSFHGAPPPPPKPLVPPRVMVSPPTPDFSSSDSSSGSDEDDVIDDEEDARLRGMARSGQSRPMRDADGPRHLSADWNPPMEYRLAEFW